MAIAKDRLQTILELTKSLAFVVNPATDGSVHLEWVSDSFTAEFGHTLEVSYARGSST